MTHSFLTRLERGPVLADGAMGTYLYERGIPFDRSFDLLNLTDAPLVQAVHRDYIRAVVSEPDGMEPGRAARVEYAQAGHVAEHRLQHRPFVARVRDARGGQLLVRVREPFVRGSGLPGDVGVERVAVARHAALPPVPAPMVAVEGCMDRSRCHTVRGLRSGASDRRYDQCTRALLSMVKVSVQRLPKDLCWGTPSDLGLSLSPWVDG